MIAKGIFIFLTIMAFNLKVYSGNNNLNKMLKRGKPIFQNGVKLWINC